MSAQRPLTRMPARPDPAFIPALVPVATPERSAKASLPILASLVMAGFVGVQLLLGVALAGGAFEVDALHAQSVELARERTATSEELVRVQSAQYLAENAESLGMVPNANPVYLRLSDAAVLGQPVATPSGGSFPGADVPNALLSGMPLASQLEAAREASALRTPEVLARSRAAESAKPATPSLAPAPGADASLALPSSEIPRLQTR